MIYTRLRKTITISLTVSLAILILSLRSPYSPEAIQPYPTNPYYWQYRGQPVMLLGGSVDDNLFQLPHLKQHLDSIQRVGANYIRNTMSSRDEGNLPAFRQLPNGQYDLEQWNPAYWNRLDSLLAWTAQREIFVQIELWDQWDYNSGRWDNSPWNPEQNVNYAVSNTRLKGSGHYQNVRHNTDQPLDLFLTVPKEQNDSLVLAYQKKFVDKVLSHTLPYDHVLYTITNELFNQHLTSWSLFWIDYVEQRVRQAGKDVQVTEMFQEHDITSQQHRVALDRPEVFDFVDMSQNSRQLDQAHWDKLQWVREYVADHPRPINHNKTYGGDAVDWTDGDAHGVERFWRNILGGAASVRFHRPPAGIGLSPLAQTQIRSARLLLDEFDIFQATPDTQSTQLSERTPDEAYLSYVPGQQYAVYFPTGGAVTLNLTGAEAYILRWLDISASTWQETVRLDQEDQIKLTTPTESGGWVALVSAEP